MQIKSDRIPFIIYAVSAPESVPRLVAWLRNKNTVSVEIFIIHAGKDKGLVKFISDNHLSDKIVNPNFKMDDIRNFTISGDKYYFYCDSNVYPMPNCPDSLLQHMISIYDKYPYVHKISSYLKKATTKQTRDKMCYIGRASTKFAVYKIGYSNIKSSSSDLITKQPYRVSDSADNDNATKLSKVVSAAAACKLTGREFSYRSRNSQQTLSFKSNTECALSDGSKGTVKIDGKTVSIKWGSMKHGHTTLIFDENYIEFKGTNNRFGPVSGMISNAVGNEDLRNQLFSTRQKARKEKFNPDPVFRIKVDNSKLPVIINNRDRLSCLKRLIEWLTKKNTIPVQIIIIDNDTTYRPTLKYYDILETNHDVKVCRMKKNHGCYAIEKLIMEGDLQYYVYTDSDIIPADSCPTNLFQRMLDVINKYPHVHKVGVSLKIDDLPHSYKLRDQVIHHERPYWKSMTDDKDAYFADIGTTMAMYRKGKSVVQVVQNNLRLAEPYVAHHTSWYLTEDSTSRDVRFYASRCSNESVWFKQMQRYGVDLSYFEGNPQLISECPMFEISNNTSTPRLWKHITERTQISPNLSILICSIETRQPLLLRLLYRLAIQLRNTEVLINSDNGNKTIGQKRNELLDQARGEYVCFIDDDDLVSFNYIDKVMHAIQSKPDCCGMEGIMTTNGGSPRKFIHSNKYKNWFEKGGVFYRNTNHLCPIKRSIATKVKFPLIDHGEDRIFSESVRTLIKSESYITNPIYYYLFRSK